MPWLLKSLKRRDQKDYVSNYFRNKDNCIKAYLLLRNINHWHPIIVIWRFLLCYCPLLVHSKCRDELSYHETSDWENYHQYNSLTNRISSSSINYMTPLKEYRLHLDNLSSRSCKNLYILLMFFLDLFPPNST